MTEFAVRVYSDRIDWDGLDAFLWWLIHSRPRAGFLADARAINRRRVGRAYAVGSSSGPLTVGMDLTVYKVTPGGVLVSSAQ